MSICEVNIDIFYFKGIFGILWYVAWIVFVFESPSVHPTITEEEKIYIELSAVNTAEVSLQASTCFPSSLITTLI